MMIRRTAWVLGALVCACNGEQEQEPISSDMAEVRLCLTAAPLATGTKRCPETDSVSAPPVDDGADASVNLHCLPKRMKLPFRQL
jgi:hypothetical protein